MDDTTVALRDAYLDLLRRSLLGLTVGPTTLYRPKEQASGRIGTWIVRALQRRGGSVLATPAAFDPSDNEEGTASVWDLPPRPMTMIGSARLKNVETCVRRALEAGVAGDLIETGVWRGGTTIFMRGILRAYGVTDRRVFVADSFAGVPPPDIDAYPADAGTDLHLWPGLVVTADEVRANFARYGLLDDRVRFVEGWFRDTLPGLRDLTWAVIRVDGDLYESTMDSLENLYGGLSPGGWVIVDDYERAPCRQAVHDFRERNSISEPIVTVDWTGICWQKEG